MAKHEIAPPDWLPFFDAFSSLHRGALVTLEVGETHEVRAYEVPLEEVAPLPGSQASVGIVLRGLPDEEVRYEVREIAHIFLTEPAGAGEGALEFEPESGPIVHLRFQRLELPEPEGDLLA